MTQTLSVATASGSSARERMSLWRLIGTDSLYRWIVIAGAALTLAVASRRLQVNVDLHIFVVLFAVFAGVYGFGLLLAWLGAYTKSFVFTGSSDFFLSYAQLMIFSGLATGLQFVVFATNFPLADAAFLRADAALGFDWYSYHAWLEHHPAIDVVLHYAYASPLVQLLAVFFVHCMRRSDDGGGDFIWCFMTTLLIVYAVALLFPALGYPGGIGQEHIDVLVAARHGTVNAVAGIVTFPSFHAALGVLFVYAMRAVKPMLVISVPLNALLILATPPIGGHYLVDVVAGVAVAGLAIALVRRFRSPSRVAVRQTVMQPMRGVTGTGVPA